MIVVDNLHLNCRLECELVDIQVHGTQVHISCYDDGRLSVISYQVVVDMYHLEVYPGTVYQKF